MKKTRMARVVATTPWVPFAMAVSVSAAAAQDGTAGPESVTSRQADFDVQVVATGFSQPYGMVFLPDGRLLVSDREAPEGIFAIDVASGVRTPIPGLPGVHFVEDDGTGVFDLILHPEYEDNGWIYVDYAHRTADGITLAVSRVRLEGTRWADHERLLVIEPAVPDNTAHLGSRLALRDGYLFVTMGERYSLRDQAQDNGNHNGTVLRIHDDGRVPDDNPFVGVPGALPEIWTYGHRNAQGLVFHPDTGDLWLNEHGPKGGDEINIVRPGRNYGWPVITYGTEYDGEGGGPIGDGIASHAGMEQPVYYYRPSIGPSDMIFYQGDAFPDWQGDVFVGAMALRHLNRLEIVDGRVINEERLLEDRNWRVRAIEEGPDGSLYLGVDAGMIVRLSPTP